MERHYTEILIEGVTFPDDVSRHVYTPICSCGWVSPYAWHNKAAADDDADEHVRVMSEGR